jgi:methyltransferase (TIGR00027 family)
VAGGLRARWSGANVPGMTSGEIQGVADTALWVATYRARESERPDALFQDPLASVLVGERGPAIARAMPRGEILQWALVLRTTAIDRLIERALERGVDTVLNLGAGLDTRPYRMKLPARLRWVEVDLPQIIELKRERLAGHAPACQLELVALDLSDVERRRLLFSEQARRAERVLVLTEGVLPYLDVDEASSLAADLHAAPAFQYWIQDFYHGKMPHGWRKRLAAAPVRLELEDWFGFFELHGWRPLERVHSMEEAKRIGRPFPQPFFGMLMGWWILLSTPPGKWHEIQRRHGFVLQERVAAGSA